MKIKIVYTISLYANWPLWYFKIGKLRANIYIIITDIIVASKDTSDNSLQINGQYSLALTASSKVSAIYKHKMIEKTKRK